MKTAWIDLRKASPEQHEAIVDAAIHARVEAVVADSAETLASLPPTVRRVLFAPDGVAPPDARPHCDLAVQVVADQAGLDGLKRRHAGGDGTSVAFVQVDDDRTLALACACAKELPYTLVAFTDPTKIPLEIVIAAADSAAGQLVTEVRSVQEAEIVSGVLEKGSDGVLLAPADANDVFGIAALLRFQTPALALEKLVVEAVDHVGIGDRVCVDTCSHFDRDEGILVGSYSAGFILVCSETHPLPYMPTRPFRVNAGALHSYVVGLDNRTSYLSELRSGSRVLAVGADGRTRPVVVGRAKLESRPLLTIRARSEQGTAVSLTVQDDWHVRVLGPGGAVLNVTELGPGDEVLGYLATDKRHVGLPIGEFCVEQ
ncbi:3-dehydroquinate synthase II [Micromonospora sp. KC721]|uniref:3-dehydroquinate synthase II family protein n=1 Tax=Micromonospora sp. KC721 TaxID=2530380 RepID=UPI0010499AD6|nr:3-dehydroquinate synthase II [Micromonospora sp. KC721]TDB81880.1 3-dehydroquinate synthase II family protein [Micromonospora sp. KC721]